MKKNKILVTGTGRAGTTLLMKLFTDLGLDTGFTQKVANNSPNEGLEKLNLNSDILIHKSPSFSLKIKDIQKEFMTAFDVDFDVLIDCAAERQKWIDMGQSLNLYNKGASLKYLNDMYMKAWESGLKTTYYLRGKAATRLEKSTVQQKIEEEPEVDLEELPEACSILDPDCESCQ